MRVRLYVLISCVLWTVECTQFLTSSSLPAFGVETLKAGLHDSVSTQSRTSVVEYAKHPGDEGPSADVIVPVAGSLSEHTLTLRVVVNAFPNISGQLRVSAKPIRWNTTLDPSVLVPIRDGAGKSVFSWRDLFIGEDLGWSANYMLLQQTTQSTGLLSVPMKMIGPLEGEILGEISLGIKIYADCLKTTRTVTVVQGTDLSGRGVLLVAPNKFVKKTVTDWEHGWVVVIENYVSMIAPFVSPMGYSPPQAPLEAYASETHIPEASASHTPVPQASTSQASVPGASEVVLLKPPMETAQETENAPVQGPVPSNESDQTKVIISVEGSTDTALNGAGLNGSGLSGLGLNGADLNDPHPYCHQVPGDQVPVDHQAFGGFSPSSAQNGFGWQQVQYCQYLSPTRLVPAGVRYQKFMIDEADQVQLTATVSSVAAVGFPAKLDVSVYSIRPTQLVGAAIMGANLSQDPYLQWRRLTQSRTVGRPKIFTLNSGLLTRENPHTVKFDVATVEGNPIVQQLEMFLSRLADSNPTLAEFCLLELHVGEHATVFAVVAGNFASNTCNGWVYGWAVSVSRL